MTNLRVEVSRIRAGWLVVAAVALVGGGLAGAALTPLAVEDEILATVVESRQPAVTTIAHLVTFLGDLWLVIGVAAAVGVLVRHRLEAPRVHLLMVLGIGGATAIVGLLKLVVARARPEMALISTWTPAYPSGHAVRAAAGYGLVVWACHHYLRHRPALRLTGTALALAIILAIAWSRLQLGVHLPSDVVVGLLVGAFWLPAVLRAVPPDGTMDGTERHRGAAPTPSGAARGRGHIAPTAGTRRRRGVEHPSG